MSDKVFLTASKDGIDFVDVDRFHKDHYSTLAYIETRAVDFGGRIELVKLRCNGRRHRRCIGNYRMTKAAMRSWDDKWSTIVKTDDGTEVIEGHDDWDCVEDMIEAGWIEVEEFKPHHTKLFHSTVKLSLTDEGGKVVSQLREHKRNDGSFSTFTPELGSK